MATRAGSHLWMGWKTQRNLPAFGTRILLPSRLSLMSRCFLMLVLILMLAVKQACRSDLRPPPGFPERWLEGDDSSRLHGLGLSEIKSGLIYLDLEIPSRLIPPFSSGFPDPSQASTRAASR